MKADEWLILATKNLASAGISTARLDAMILLEDATNLGRANLLAHPEQQLSTTQSKFLANCLARRIQHEPLAYIRGHCEFFGRDFVINSDTLQPRPESETFINILKTLLDTNQSTTILDIGTGSGALAITASLEFGGCTVLASDISTKALKVARSNAKKLGAKVTFLNGNLLAPLSPNHFPIDIIMANLPYVPDQHIVNRAAMYEPKLAIYGGTDGLDIYRIFFQQIEILSKKPTVILTESMQSQHLALTNLATAHGYDMKKSEGLVLYFRINQS